MLVLNCFASIWCSSSSSDSGLMHSNNNNVIINNMMISAKNDRDVSHIELKVLPANNKVDNLDDLPQSSSRIVPADIEPYVPKNQAISQRERNELLQELITFGYIQKPTKMRGVSRALMQDRQRSEQIERGFEVTIEKDAVKPPINWLVSKYVRKESDFLGHKVTREQKIKWITGVASFIVASGLTYGANALIVYLSSEGGE